VIWVAIYTRFRLVANASLPLGAHGSLGRWGDDVICPDIDSSDGETGKVGGRLGKAGNADGDLALSQSFTPCQSGSPRGCGTLGAPCMRGERGMRGMSHTDI
jgi:hypothetical protein